MRIRNKNSMKAPVWLATQNIHCLQCLLLNETRVEQHFWADNLGALLCCFWQQYKMMSTSRTLKLCCHFSWALNGQRAIQTKLVVFRRRILNWGQSVKVTYRVRELIELFGLIFTHSTGTSAFAVLALQLGNHWSRGLLRCYLPGG